MQIKASNQQSVSDPRAHAGTGGVLKLLPERLQITAAARKQEFCNLLKERSPPQKGKYLFARGCVLGRSFSWSRSRLQNSRPAESNQHGITD